VAGAGLALVVAVAGIVVVSVAGVGGLVTSVALLMLAGAVIGLRSRRRSDQAAAARRARVIEACAVLSADLRAGRPPQDALAAASEVCAELGPAAEIAKLGGNVGAALSESSAAPGAAGLAALGAAWQVVERSGVALSSVASRLAESLRADETARRQATAALAGARSTARLLASLPLLGTALGHLLGAEPVAFLTGTPPGWFCLLAGVALMIAGLAWVERLIAEPLTGADGRVRATGRRRVTRPFGAWR
jgi:tight adherence protein B